MDISADMEEIGVASDQRCFVSAFKQTSTALILFVEITAICRHNPAHQALHGAFVDLVDEQVKVIRHQAITEQLDRFMQLGIGNTGTVSDLLAR